MITCTFTKDATSITLPAPTIDRPREARKFQAQGRGEEGTLFVYSSAVSTFETTLSFEGLTDSEKDDLLSFFQTTVSGVSQTFTYTNPLGTAYTARFLSPDLDFLKVSDGIWDIQFDLELSALEG